jgi:hypothetical protein
MYRTVRRGIERDFAFVEYPAECSLELDMPKPQPPTLFEPLTRIENACRRVSGVMLTAPNITPSDNELVRREIQEIKDALEAFQGCSRSRRSDGI